MSGEPSALNARPPSSRAAPGRPISPVELLSTATAPRLHPGGAGLSALAVLQYWVAQMSRGRIPPPAKKSEEELMAFVAQNPGAIGYVSGATAVPDTVRVLQID